MAERISYILSEIKAERGISATAFADAIGVSKGAVSKWASGETANLKNEHLFSIEEKFGYSARWIAAGKGPQMLVELQEEAAGYIIRQRIETGQLLDISQVPGAAKSALRATLSAFQCATTGTQDQQSAQHQTQSDGSRHQEKNG